MADFEIAHKKFLTTQGDVLNNNKKNTAYILCSECFNDEGLRIIARYIGDFDERKCKSCKSTKGNKLNKSQIEELSYNFFVRGSFIRCDFGGFPQIQFNKNHYNNTSISFKKWIENDIKLIEEKCKIGFFNYGPRFWMFGEIEPLKSLQKKGKESTKVINEIIEKYPIKYLDEKVKFYRIRISPNNPNDPNHYDSPPKQFLGINRFDAKNFPVFYASPDLELCIHECRATVNDEIYCATIKPTKALKMLDLTAIINEDEGITEFESLEMAVHFLFLASQSAYPICRKISKIVKKAGYDGIIFPSYFSYVRTGSIPLETVYGVSLRKLNEFKNHLESQIVPNVVIFGRPLKQKKIKVKCINVVQITKIDYHLNFGTVEKKEFSEELYVQEKTKEFISKITDNLKKNNCR